MTFKIIFEFRDFIFPLSLYCSNKNSQLAITIVGNVSLEMKKKNIISHSKRSPMQKNSLFRLLFYDEVSLRMNASGVRIFGWAIALKCSMNFSNHVWFDAVSLFDMFDIQLSLQMFCIRVAHRINIVANATIVGSYNNIWIHTEKKERNKNEYIGCSNGKLLNWRK